MDLSVWLQSLGLERYEPAFRESEVTVEILPELTDADLRELGLPLGPRKTILKAIASLTDPSAAPEGLRTVPPEGWIAPPPQERQEPAPQAERRQITVLFADLVGSTRLSTHLDPEDMRDILRTYQNAVTGEIARVNGHVAKLMGDGVLAYFGWPRAHEDDAECAVRAGLAIAQAVGRLTTPTGKALAARVGIATGLVVVGDLVGEGAAREEAIVGETPNLGARLQESAPAGSVVIADSTRRLLGDLFELCDLGPAHLKGFAAPVLRFQVLREQPTHSRFEAQRPDRALPMVGRSQELALILERWQHAVSGEGQAVLLVGEAGIGKSRLVQAVLDAAAEGETFVLRYQCSPHHTGTALWPVIQQFAFAAGFEPADSNSVKRDKLEALLRQGDADPSAAPVLAALLGIDEGPQPTGASVTPHQQRARTLATLVDQLRGLARRRPVLMVMEDTHWIDPTTLELLGEVLDGISEARVLVLLTSRPDNQPALGGHPHVTRLTLNRLGRTTAEAIVARLTEGRSLPPALLDEITARTDGVPLFVEELTKAVLEVGITAPGMTVPVSLHASLMARLDRVPEVKEVAQVAACIGREFPYRLLETVSGLPHPKLCAALDRLAAAELIFRRGVPPEATYTFKHALVRDAAHESLLKSYRQELHARILRALEERFPEIVEAEPELLARHCMDAGRTERAVHYWQTAAQHALARSATAEAISHLTRALEGLESTPDGPERQGRELTLQVALGRASIAAYGFAAPVAGRAYARARTLCDRFDATPEVFPVLYGQSVFHFQRGELAKAHEVAWDLLRLAERQGNAAAQVTGHRMVGSTLGQLGRLAESRDHFETALALYDPVRDRSSASVYAIDSRVMCLCWLAHIDALLGRPDEALARDAAVPAHVDDLGHSNTAAVALAWSCIFRQLLRDGPAARERAEAAIALATEQGFPLYRAVGVVTRGWALAAGGHAGEGADEIRQGVADYASTGAEMWSPYFLALLAEALGLAGDPGAGLAVLSEAFDRAGRMGSRWTEAELHRLRGELLLAGPKPEETAAEAAFRRSLAIAQEQGAAMWELRTATSLFHLASRQGRPQDVHGVLRSAYERFPPGVETSDLGAARSLLTGGA